MKTSYQISIPFLIALIFSLNLTAKKSCDLLELDVTINAGTTVSVELNEELFPESTQAGRLLDFSVRNNVMVNGQVLIADGAMAEGRIIRTRKTGKRGCIEIFIEVLNVLAVDGQRIRLRGNTKVLLCSAKRRKQISTTTIGKKISAKTLNNDVINA